MNIDHTVSEKGKLHVADGFIWRFGRRDCRYRFLFYRVISGFLLPMFLAALLVVIFQPWFRYFIAKCGGRIRLAAILTTISAVVVAIGPATLVGALAVWELWPGGGTTGHSLQRTLRDSAAGLRTSLEDISGKTLKLDAEFDGKSYFDELRYIESSLASLRAHAAMGATYRGDEAALAKLLAAIDDLETIIAAEDRAEEEERRKKELPLDKASLLHEAGETLRMANSDATVVPGSLQYQLLLDEADQEFRAFKVVLFNNARERLAGGSNESDRRRTSCVEQRLVRVRARIVALGGWQNWNNLRQHHTNAAGNRDRILFLSR